MIRLVFSIVFFLLVSISNAQEKSLLAGIKLTKSTKIKKANYNLDASSDQSKSLVLIEGDNITIDFSNCTLQGSNKTQNPDEFFGIAILVRNSKNVTIKNLKARGYKVALMARNVTGLILDHCDLSYNYRPHLNSTQEKEDVSDWMSYHQNEKDEWLRYGAAIYLRDCRSVTVKFCIVTGGQNALMMTGCNNGKIFNNDFSFNSGIGIGMYRCNANEILYNKINFNVRGYSHGVYNRGQDSAGILVYEQSSYNIFYKNSVTHGGDGFFLWAGQTTMDNGKGGCNDNVIWENNFSYAPTNGIEVTFSRNNIMGNRIFECDHGIWGGYSYSTSIADNQFRDNRIGIAIEHGQHNEISNNLFLRDKEAIRLWSNPKQDPSWGYAKYHDTRSADYFISINSFNSNPIAVNITRTDSAHLFGNTFSNCDKIYKFDSSVTHIDSAETLPYDTTIAIPSVTDPIDPFKGSRKLAGRKNILITQWGPYDFRSPIIWNTNPTDKSDTLKFKLFGPAGKWEITGFKGVTGLTKGFGSFPDSITVLVPKSDKTDLMIELEYKGPAFIDQFGKTNTANKPYRFYFRKFFQPIDWEVLYYSLDTMYYNPIKTGLLFSPVERKAPFKTEKVDKLDYAWWGGINASDQQHIQFITAASGQANFEKGEYELAVTWDDAVRIWVDEKLVIDEWNPSRYSFDESPHKKVKIQLNGIHHFRVEHVELGGFATLSLKINPVR